MSNEAGEVIGASGGGGGGAVEGGGSLLDGQRVGARDGVAVQECEELAEGVEEGPMGEQADALVGVHGARGGGGVGGVGGAGWLWVGAQQTQLGALLLAQTLLGEGLVELDGRSVDLKHGTSQPEAQPPPL